MDKKKKPWERRVHKIHAQRSSAHVFFCSTKVIEDAGYHVSQFHLYPIVIGQLSKI